MAVGTQTKVTYWRSDDLGAQLLPGIPNEVTLDLISPKLPWTVFHVLASVSRYWLEAIQSRQVYDARVRTQATETIVCITRSPLTFEDTKPVILCSAREDSCYELPRIPNFDSAAAAVPYSCKSISLDGKIYILGGLVHGEGWLGSAEVFVFDVAGQRQWKQCASMQEGRHEFGCGVIDGKIYVCGGTSLGKPVRGSEVFDPKLNAWSPIMPMKSSRCNHLVAIAGGELFAFGGMIFDDAFKWDANPDEDRPQDHLQWALSLEIYHPSEDKWRVVDEDSDIPHSRGPFYMGKGNLFFLTWREIEFFGFDRASWTHRHPNCFAATEGPSAASGIWVHNILVVNGELLAVVQDGFEDPPFILQGKGRFGMENNPIVWQKPACSLSCDFGEVDMCPIQL